MRNRFRSHHQTATRLVAPTNDAFTLIELLVVLSIIMLLLSILLPSMANSRMVARDVLCRTRLKSGGASVYMYYTDHNMAFPGQKGNPTDVTHPNSWVYKLNPYFGLEYDTFTCTNGWDSRRDKTKPGVSYFFNWYLANHNIHPYTYNDARRPSRSLVISDHGPRTNHVWVSGATDAVAHYQWFWWYTHPRSHRRVAGDHRNVLFADHHVAAAPVHSIQRPEMAWTH